MATHFKNIFKTLFFFDVIAIINYFFISVERKDKNLEFLLNNCVLAALIGLFTFFFIFILEKKQVIIPFKKQPKNAAISGAVLGAFVPILCVSLLIAFGKGEILGFNKIAFNDIYKYFLPTAAVSVILNELLFRGYLFSLYKKHYGFWPSAIITTALWLAFNPDYIYGNKLLLVNLILLNVLLCCVYEFTGSFISVLVARFIYLIISCFLLGSLPLGSTKTLLKTKGFAGFGLESSLIFTVVVIAIIYLFLCIKYDINTKTKNTAVNAYKWLKNFDIDNLLSSLKLKFQKLKMKVFKK